MKNFNLLVTLLFLTQLSAIQTVQCHELGSTEKLAPAENTAVLEEIDSICADTWCEGDYNFSFDRLSCPVNKNKCLLDLTFINSYDEEDENTDQKFPVTCAIAYMETKEDIMETNGVGRVVYSQKLYNGISQCISDHQQDARDYFDHLRNQ